MISTTAYCGHCKNVEEISVVVLGSSIHQTEVPSATVKARLECGHGASLVMSHTNIDAVRLAGVTA